jgi:murein DD-endopeptidase MepM/ murein hydrolase activator NlpD
MAKFPLPLFGLLVILLLGACSSGGGPQVRIFDGSSVPSGGTGSANTVGGSSSVSVAQPEDGIHRVARGETLYAISREYGVPLRSLIVENNLTPPYDLLVGQRLRIPAVRLHTVRPGETVYGISRQYGVAMNELVRANQIPSPYRIKVGQRLNIPAQTGSVRQQTVALSPSAPDDGTISQEPLPPSGTSSPVGQDETPASSDPTAADPQPSPPQQASYGPGEVVYPPAKPNAPPRLVGPIPRPPPMTGQGFLWPVQGKVVSGYGAKGRGLHNDGINIAAPRNSPIRAAESGVVAYAGDGLQGFGNIVLIKHQNGYVTAYAHADSLLVTRGQVIQRGQAIARVGSTGNVETPQVHFQIRKGRQAIDPRTLLLTS